jgi:osmotically-inducible protein OsmY
MSRLPTFLLGAAAGAAAAHFLDPDKGPERRSSVAAQAASTAKSGAAVAQSQATKVAGKAQGAAPGAGLSEPDDVTLARKVETEIFRAPDAPKGAVSVDVQDGVAHLRGEVASEEWVARLAAEAGNVEGVKGVENLLHPPGTPAPSAPGS